MFLRAKTRLKDGSQVNLTVRANAKLGRDRRDRIRHGVTDGDGDARGGPAIACRIPRDLGERVRAVGRGRGVPGDLAVVARSFEPFATAHLVSTPAPVAEIPARTSEKPVSTALPE